ncbi:MAG: flippase-like domain-containing protein [Acidimicrobiales bacterium]|nr:flippase-like domain-containing protein [Acidimicrobiales bacterium]
MAKTLLVGSLVALVAAAWLAFTPLRNPGVQDCGTAIGFVVFNRPDLKATPGESPEATRRSLQPTCRERAVPQMQRAAIAFAAFVGLGLLGAVVGLIDDRIAYRRAPRFESLLRAPPPDAPGMYLRPPPQLDQRQLGRVLPPFERLDLGLLLGVGVLSAAGLVWLAGSQQVDVVSSGLRWPFVAVVVAAIFAGHLIAAAQLALSAPAQVRLIDALEVTAASNFASRLLPPLGPLGLEAHFLAKRAHGEVSAVLRAEGGRQLIGVFGFVTVSVVAVLQADLRHLPHVDLPKRWPYLLAAVCLFLLLGVSRAADRIRYLTVKPSFDGLRSLLTGSGGAGLGVAAVALPLAHVVAFGASVATVGGELSFWRIAVIALVSMLAAALVPTPGGVGAVECTAVLGLLIAGVAVGTAVVAVLVWRSLTFWVPLVVGAFPFQRLRRTNAL